MATMRTRCWSAFPEDLLAFIAELLDVEIEVLRFRAVCTSWCSSVSYPHSYFPLKLPFTISLMDCFSATFCSSFALTEHTVYLFQLPRNDGVTASTHQAFPHLGWLVRVREKFPGRFRVFNPLSKLGIDYCPKTFRNLNLLNFQVTEVSKVYDLCFFDSSAYNYVLRNPELELSQMSLWKKVILSGHSVSTESRDRVVVAIQEKGSLLSFMETNQFWVHCTCSDLNPHRYPRSLFPLVRAVVGEAKAQFEAVL